MDNIIHFAVCTESTKGRVGFVVSDKDSKWVSDMSNLVGYVGCCSFSEAIQRAGMMELNKADAWGVIPA